MSEEIAADSTAGTRRGPETPHDFGVSAAPRGKRPPFLAWIALSVAALSLFAPLSSSGIWDPPEREVAELSRRIALNLLGSPELAVAGGNNLVPTRAELGRGELPFTSIALGFRAFGLHDWAGRLPLALWAALGLLATYGLVRRLSDRRSAWFAVLALSTMPLYFLHARTMLGDIVTMASLALALAGLGVAVFERGSAASNASRILFLGVGLLGMACALLSRGTLIGVAVPGLSVGVSWLVLRTARVISAEWLGDALGALVLVLAAVAAVLAGRALYVAPQMAGQFSLLLGTAVHRPRVLPTFDSVILQLGHALFPWSAVIPVALGSLLREPPIPAGPTREREAALRVLVLALPVFAWLAYGLAEPVVGALPFGGVAAFAIAVALLMRDYERGVSPARAVPMVVCALAILLLVDFENLPEKALSAFCVPDVRFPDSFKLKAGRLLEAGTLLFCASFFFLLQERSTHQDARFERAEYGVWPRAFRMLWTGNLQFAVIVLEAALVGFCGLGFLSDHLSGFAKVDALGAGPRAAALFGALALPGLLISPLLLMAVRDAFRTLFDPELGALFGSGAVGRWLSGGLSRAEAALFAGVAFGLCLSLVFYPALSVQISPKQVFEAYRRDANAGEPLGMLGAGAASANYYAGRIVPSFDTGAHAFDWLIAGSERRWLVIRQSDLPLLNSLYRARNDESFNLPVLDARSSEILLVSSQLGAARNDNPLSGLVLEQAPQPRHPLDANLDDKLDVLGWDTLAEDGRAVSSVQAGRRYTFVIYYRVVQHIAGTWDTFIHIDGFQRRFNADHPTLDGKYPFGLWQPGDWIADRHELMLEPNFSAGTYRVYFGLYNGSQRLDVRRGHAVENRLEAGVLDVR